MRVGIHQINYFPWMGYFNKIAKSDKFVLLDEVQLTDSETMQRNRLLNKNGDIAFITVAFNKKNYMRKKFADIETNKNVDWQKRQYNFLYDNYHKFDAWNEVYDAISPIFENDYNTLQEVNIGALNIICNLLNIDTSKFIYQSSLDYDRKAQKNDLVLNICKSVNADIYLSGNGAKKYMDIDSFSKAGITVQYQKFVHPEYPQKYSKDCVKGLSILDVLLNCGIEDTRELFWKNLCADEN